MKDAIQKKKGRRLASVTKDKQREIRRKNTKRWSGRLRCWSAENRAAKTSGLGIQRRTA
jgi:hypothetical protein